MPFKADIRTQKLEKIKLNSATCGSKKIMYKTQRNVNVDAYEIPVEFLIFNKYNGRISTSVKTHEKQHGVIDPTEKEGEEIIKSFLWNSNRGRNKETLNDIKDKGQSTIGIVTKDGVVIDGNRRCMLLKMLSESNHFQAVILDDTLEDNAKEIRKLETIYQMGVDEKVDYNAIEKYLKCKDLSEVDGFSLDEIAKMMGERPKDIEKYLGILGLMEEYLSDYEYEGMYTRLQEESVEGPFVDLHGYLKKQEDGRNIQGRDWEPQKEDIDDLKKVTFDYIRGGFRTAHGIRDIGNPAKGQGFFNHEKIWKEFVKRHESGVEKIEEQSLDEWRGERPNEDAGKIIRQRESKWKSNADSMLKENYHRTRRELEDRVEADSPAELLRRAEKTLMSINTDSDAFNEDVLDKIKVISKMLWDFQKIIKRKGK